MFVVDLSVDIHVMRYKSLTWTEKLSELHLTNLSYDLARSKREYCQNCSVAVVL